MTQHFSFYFYIFFDLLKNSSSCIKELDIALKNADIKIFKCKLYKNDNYK